LSDNREKEVEALARFLCQLHGVNGDVLVAVGEPLRVNAGVLLGYQVSSAMAYEAWKWYAPMAIAILDAGWLRKASSPETPEDRDARLEEEDMQLDAALAEKAVGALPVEETAERPRAPEERWRDNAGLR
jgi:hypothetical protein